MDDKTFPLDVFYFFCVMHYLSIINVPTPQVVQSVYK